MDQKAFKLLGSVSLGPDARECKFPVCYYHPRCMTLDAAWETMQVSPKILRCVQHGDMPSVDPPCRSIPTLVTGICGIGLF